MPTVPFCRRPLLAALLALFLLVPLAGCELFSSEDDDGIAERGWPEPTGSFRVGTASLHLIDERREEIYTDAPGDARELMVQLWYPADTRAGTQAPYMVPAVAALYASFQDYVTPEEMEAFMGTLETGGGEGVPVSGETARLPVVLFSHGHTGVRSLLTTFAEELASHGYVVAGIDHTYGAFATAFPDGRVVSFSLNEPPRLQVWAEDLSFVLDELTRLDAADPAGLLTGRLDLDRVGALGHSFGGTAVMEAHVFDRRFDAGIALDSPQVGSARQAGLDEPFLFAFAEDSEFFERTVQGRLRARGYTAVVEGTTHYSFSDLPVLVDLAGVPPTRAAASLQPPGTIDPERNLEILGTLFVAFFDRHLRGASVPLLDDAALPFSEVAFEIHEE